MNRKGVSKELTSLLYVGTHTPNYISTSTDPAEGEIIAKSAQLSHFLLLAVSPSTIPNAVGNEVAWK